jgi:DNA polymerase elongation subunit (family B)
VKILAWDIELTPMTVYSWSLWPNFITIQQIEKPQEVMCFGARWYGKNQVIFKSTHHHGKQEMLETIHALLDEADAVMSWNGASFDTKHINREFIENGMAPPSPYIEIDLMRVAKRKFKFASNKLDWVSQMLDVGKKVQHEGFQLWLDCMDGSKSAWKKMKEYQLQDVNLLIDLYEKLLPWIDNHPNVNTDLKDIENCVACGSDHVVRNGTRVLSTGKYLRYQCQNCGKWMRGKTAIATTSLRN